MFEDFTKHPEFRGEKFSFERFGECAGRLARVNLFMSFRGFDKIKREKQEELENLAYEAAKARWDELAASRIEEI